MRMLTHVDLMKFNSMVRHIGNCQAEVYELFDTLGLLEACDFGGIIQTDASVLVEAAAFTGSRRKLVLRKGITH